MAKNLLLFPLILMAASGLANAATLSLSAAGKFANSDSAGLFVSPGASFDLHFNVITPAVPLSGSVTSLGFDVPIAGFLYRLNGTPVNVAPTEIRFNTLANGGLFDITFGSGFTAVEFDFQGVQAFTGTTAAPVFLTGALTATSWNYSDPLNFDPGTAMAAAVSLSAVPEPSSSILFSSAFLAAAATLRRKLRNE